MGRLTLLTALSALIITGRTEAQEVNGVVNETTVGAEELVTFTLQVSGAEPGEVSAVRAPSTEGLRLISRNPSQQSNLTIVNGRVSRSVGYIWRYQPVGVGQARILSASATIAGQLYSTAPITITVVPRSERTTSQPRSFFDFFDDPQAPPDPPRAADRDIFIRAIPSAGEAYRNEQVIIDYELYYKAGTRPRNSRLADSWDAEGFWREDLEVAGGPAPRTTILNGQRYNYMVLKRVAVFPTRSGELTVDPLRISTEIIAGSGGLFSRRYFSSNYVDVERGSSPVNIRVKPLPDGALAEFTNAVGDYTMRASLSRESVKVGESLQLDLEIDGTGNIALLDAPNVTFPGAFELYEPQVSTNKVNVGNRVRGNKTFTWLMVPRSNGTFTIPPIRMAYFNPNTESYVTEEVSLPSIRVTGASGADAVSSTAAGFPADDIAPIMSATRLLAAVSTPLHKRAWLYVLLLVPIFALGGTVLARRRATRLATDTAWARQRRAHPLACKHLKNAAALCQSNAPEAFYEAMERAVLGFIGNWINVAELGMTRAQLGATLERAGVSAALQADTLAFLDACDSARFAPRRASISQMEGHLVEARRLLTAIAQELES